MLKDNQHSGKKNSNYLKFHRTKSEVEKSFGIVCDSGRSSNLYLMHTLRWKTITIREKVWIMELVLTQSPARIAVPVVLLFRFLHDKSLGDLLVGSLSKNFSMHSTALEATFFPSVFYWNKKLSFLRGSVICTFLTLIYTCKWASWHTVILMFVYIFTATATGFHHSFRLTGITGVYQGKNSMGSSIRR